MNARLCPRCGMHKPSGDHECLFPERWINVDSDGHGATTREVVDRHATPTRIGVIHVSPDGTVELIDLRGER